jgi:dienelactone hydrolase
VTVLATPSWLQFKQVCDKLAAAGYLVVGPDVFRGKPWTMEKFPPKPEDNLLGWIQGHSWDVSACAASQPSCWQ